MAGTDTQATRFHKDFFYRLSVFKIEIPPLRQRNENIPIITDPLIKQLCAEYGIEKLPGISANTFEIMKSHNWPGNVRELRNVLSRPLAMGNLLTDRTRGSSFG